MHRMLAELSAADPAAALTAACRLAYVRGLVGALAGNASVRAGDSLLCTESGCCLGEVRPEALVRCGPDGAPQGTGVPTSEWRLHCCLYAARPGIGAVLHTHSRAAVSLALQRRGLPPLTAELAHFLDEVPCVPFAPAGSLALGLAVAAVVRADAGAALLERHGAVSWGPDVRTAFFLAELLESGCALAADAAAGASAQ